MPLCERAVVGAERRGQGKTQCGSGVPRGFGCAGSAVAVCGAGLGARAAWRRRISTGSCSAGWRGGSGSEAAGGATAAAGQASGPVAGEWACTQWAISGKSAGRGCSGWRCSAAWISADWVSEWRVRTAGVSCQRRAGFGLSCPCAVSCAGSSVYLSGSGACGAFGRLAESASESSGAGAGAGSAQRPQLQEASTFRTGQIGAAVASCEPVAGRTTAEAAGTQ